MSLTKEDLVKIKKVVEAGNEYLDAKWNKRFNSLDLYLDTRFGKIDKRLDDVGRKIDQLIKTENEDIQVAFREIQSLKIRLEKLEGKLKLA